MKKTFMLLVAAFTITLANAQTSSNIMFGLKAGANFSNWTGDDSDDAEILTGFHAGATVNIPFGNMWAVQPEIMFSTEGAKFEGGKLVQNYIRIPVLFQYVNTSGFYAETGPSIGFLMTAEAKEDGVEDADMKEFFNSTDFSWTLGLGYKTKSGFGIGARYNMGLSSIAKEDAVDVKNTNIQVGVFYLLGGNK
jgi:hypothetical protein